MRKAAGPEAVEIYVRFEMEGFRRKAMVVRGRVGRMVFALERVSEDDDEFHGWVGVDGQIEVASGHLVNFINDQYPSAFEKGGFPGGDAPVVGVLGFDGIFPFGAEFSGGDRDFEVLEGWGAE